MMESPQTKPSAEWISEERALEWLENEPWFAYTEKGWSYYHRFFLDISDLERRSSKFEETRQEYNSMLDPRMSGETMKQIADSLVEKTENNWQAVRCSKLLECLDADPKKTLDFLNRALQYHVVKPGDEKYEDFSLPEFEVVNAERYHREFNEIDWNEHSGQLIHVTGHLLDLSDPPEVEYLKMAYYCSSCDQDFLSLEKADKCPLCRAKDPTFLPEDEHTVSRNFQEGILQRPVDDMAGFPSTLRLKITGGMVDRQNPGDKVHVTGYLELIRIPRKKTMMYQVEVISVQVEEKDLQVTEHDRKKIREFSEKEDPLQGLSDIFAPEIIGNRSAKMAILLQHAGGVEKTYERTRTRGRIHVLLAGDPGLGKSQLLMASSGLVKPSIYSSDASKAGLTVSVSEVGKKKVLVPGIMVLANGGTARIDELDKMSREDREGLHSAMEQGIISKTKAGLRGTYHTDTSVLAAANPVHGKFALDRDIPDQLKLEPTLLDRFDLILWFISRPQTEEEILEETRLILNPPGSQDQDFIAKYLTVAAEYSPEFSPDVDRYLRLNYAEAKMKSPDTNSLGIRALHALRRFSEASAKIRMSDRVQNQDVDIALRLLGESWKQLGYDLTRVLGAGSRTRKAISFVQDILSQAGGTVKWKDFESSARAENISIGELNEAISKMKAKGEVLEPRNGVFEVVS